MKPDSAASPEPSGLRWGRHRLSYIRARTLSLRFLLYGMACLVILYAGLVAMGQTRGFAYLAASEFGKALGDALTADKARTSFNLQHLELRDIRSITNKNQKVVFTRIERLALDFRFRDLERVAVHGPSFEVMVHADATCTPTAFAFLGKLPLLGRLEAFARTGPAKAEDAASKESDTPPAPAPEPAEATEDSPGLQWERLPPFELTDGSLRLKNHRGELLAEFDAVNLRWTPAAATTNGTDVLTFQIGYRIPQRKLPRLVARAEIRRKDGHYQIDNPEIEPALLLEIGRHLRKLEQPPPSAGGGEAAGTVPRTSDLRTPGN